MAISPTYPLKDVKITIVGNLAQTEIDLSQQDKTYLFTRVWQIQVQSTFCKVSFGDFEYERRSKTKDQRPKTEDR